MNDVTRRLRYLPLFYQDLDQATEYIVDVTDIPDVQEGDTAILFGSPELTADEAAAWLKTINYEVTCLVSSHVPRVYK